MRFSKILFFIIAIVLFLLAFFNFKGVESDIIKAFIPNDKKVETSYLAKLSKVSEDKINIIYMADSISELENLKQEAVNKFEQYQKNFKDEKIIEIYKNYPNFLSNETIKLLKQKNYNEINRLALIRLYNPFGFYVIAPHQDPFILATDFVNSILSEFVEDTNIEKDGKHYSLSRYKIDKNDIKNIIETKNEINKEHSGKTYLTGSLIHSYYCAKQSAFEINIICFIAFLIIIFIGNYFFKSYKILSLIAFSVLFGVLAGFSVCAIIFKNIHILAFVFSTSLIGISLDYSLHKFIAGEDKNFNKSLLISLLSTILAFIPLYFSNIEVLKQISVFTIFGLVGVYFFVVLVLPLFNVSYTVKYLDIKIPEKFKKAILLTVILVIAAGAFNIKFSDDIKSLYKPKGELKIAESIYNKISVSKKPQFILLKGNSVDEILEKEESISKLLDENNIKYIALSKFVSSKKRQRENFELIQELYKNNLNNYADFLDAKTKKELINANNFKVYNPDDFPYNENFMLDNNTSYMLLSDYNGSLNIKTGKIIDIQNELSNILKAFKIKCFELLPILFLIIFSILFFTSNKKLKPAFKTILPSFLGAFLPVCLFSLFNIQINVFHILATILVVGFSLDYCVFRKFGDKKSETAVFISFLSSFTSFLMLSFVSFELISSLGMTIATGILTAYLLSLVLIKN